MACASLKSDGEAPVLSPVDMSTCVESLLERRGHLAAEVARIDDELDRVFARLAADRRLCLPAVLIASDLVTAASFILPPEGTCARDVLAQVLQGRHTTSELAAVLTRWSRGRIGDALKYLVHLGWLQRAGASTATRYEMAPGAIEAMRQA